ncbi:EB domain-containing julius seizure protein isoform X2 [Andrena cerasifolii]
MHASDAVAQTASLPSSTSPIYATRKSSSAARLICTVFISWWIIKDQLALGLTEPPELTTLEDLSERGPRKFGDQCEDDRECGFTGSYCEPKKSKCACREEFEATNHIDKCGHPANVNESCFFNEQCEAKVIQTECRDGRCICIFEKIPVTQSDGLTVCVAEQKEEPNLQYIDPTMIGVLVGMALMFIILCVVLRLFSKARWRENRTIFNTPNARLMNVSLLRENKLLHPQERRGSRASVRVPSRQPSMASLRAHSPNASQGAKHSQHSQHRGHEQDHDVEAAAAAATHRPYQRNRTSRHRINRAICQKPSWRTSPWKFSKQRRRSTNKKNLLDHRCVLYQRRDGPKDVRNGRSFAAFSKRLKESPFNVQIPVFGFSSSFSSSSVNFLYLSYADVFIALTQFFLSISNIVIRKTLRITINRLNNISPHWLLKRKAELKLTNTKWRQRPSRNTSFNVERTEVNDVTAEIIISYRDNRYFIFVSVRRFRCDG